MRFTKRCISGNVPSQFVKSITISPCLQNINAVLFKHLLCSRSYIFKHNLILMLPQMHYIINAFYRWNKWSSERLQLTQGHPGNTKILPQDFLIWCPCSFQPPLHAIPEVSWEGGTLFKDKALNNDCVSLGHLRSRYKDGIICPRNELQETAARKNNGKGVRGGWESHLAMI